MNKSISRLILYIFTLATILLLTGTVPASAKALTVSIIDVGQGDSILVEFPDGKNMLIDAGDREHGQTVVKYLKNRHATKIDILVVSHPHEDHIGGMEDVLSSIRVDRVLDSGYNHGSQVQKRYLKNFVCKISGLFQLGKVNLCYKC